MNYAMFALFLVLLACKLAANAAISWWLVCLPLLWPAGLGLISFGVKWWHEYRMLTEPAYKAQYLLGEMAKRFNRR